MDSSLYFYALLSTSLFGFSSLIFTEYTRKISSIWMNCVKAGVAMIAALIVVSLFYQWNPVSTKSVGLFMFSGIIGLTLADILLLNSFKRLGPGRALVLFGFHPLTLGIASYLVLGQEVSTSKFYAIIFLVGCLVVFSYEKFKTDGHWEIKGLLLALSAVLMDATGLLITRIGFDISPQVTPLEGHFYRCSGSSLGFLFIQLISPFGLLKNFQSLPKKTRWVPLAGGLLGTFFSLWAYFIAIQKGNLASVTAVAITSPFIATIFECAYYRKKPSIYLMVAFVFFVCGFIILVM